MKRVPLVEEHIQGKMDTRKRPVHREKQKMSIFAFLGIVLFLISMLLTLLFQLHWLWNG